MLRLLALWFPVTYNNFCVRMPPGELVYRSEAAVAVSPVMWGLVCTTSALAVVLCAAKTDQQNRLCRLVVHLALAFLYLVEIVLAIWMVYTVFEITAIMFGPLPLGKGPFPERDSEGSSNVQHYVIDACLVAGG
jgi:heme A synthase